MKIAIDARSIRSSTGRYSRQLLKHLQEIDTDNEYHVIIHTKDQGVWHPKAKNFHLHVVNQDHYGFGEQLGLAWFLYRLRVDLVHFTMPQQPILYFKKHITTFHDLTLVHFKNIDKNKYIYAIQQFVFKLLVRIVARTSAHIVAVSEHTKNDLVSFTSIKPKKVSVVYEAAEPLSETQPKPVEGLAGKDFILYVGNAFPYKNLKTLVNAHHILRKKLPDTNLVLAGKKEFFYKQLEGYVNDNSYDGVYFLDFVSDEELVWLYKHGQAYVFPSLAEGFGLPGLEAMSYGLPVVSSNASCLPEVYGEAAHYFDPNKVEEIAEAVYEVIDDRDLRERLKDGGKQRLKRFSWQETAKYTHNIYKKYI